MSDPITPTEVAKQAAERSSSVLADIIGSLAWPLVIVGVLVLYRVELRALMGVFADRLRAGGGLKVGSFEVSAVDVTRVDLSKTNASARRDDGRRTKDRDEYYEKCRNVLLVHRLARSRTAGQLFDVLVYLIPHERKGTLASVQEVEYFFGKFWKCIVYNSTNRHAGFPLRLSAYGPTLCSAKVIFTDGETVTLHRYLDFEMGAVAPLLAEPENRK